MKSKDSITTLNLKVRSELPAYVKAHSAIHDLLHKNGRKKQPFLTSLQTELLYRYTQEPSEKQMKQLGVFRFYLLNSDYYHLKSQEEIDTYASLPKKKLPVKREQLSAFQNELLNIYDHEPTELQMQKLEDFLFKLFNNLLNKFDEKKDEVMVA